MKSIKVFSIMLAIAGLFITNVSSADIDANKYVTQKVQQAIYFPTPLKDKIGKGEVRVAVSADAEGHLSVNEINSTHPELKDFVVSKLSSLKLNTEKLIPGETYYIKITFKVVSA